MIMYAPEAVYKVGDTYYDYEDDAYEAAYRLNLEASEITKDDLIIFTYDNDIIPLEDGYSAFEDIFKVSIKTEKGLDFFIDLYVDRYGSSPRGIEKCGSYSYDSGLMKWNSYESELNDFNARWGFC